MALDRRGRLIFYGFTQPEAHSFFRLLDAADGTLVYDKVFDDAVLGSLRSDIVRVQRRRLDTRDRGVSIILKPYCGGRACDPPRALIATLAEDGNASVDAIPGSIGHPAILHPHGHHLLTNLGGSLILVPVGSV